VGGVGGVLAADDTAPMRGDALAAVEELDGGCMRQRRPVENGQLENAQRLARMLVTDPVYLKNLAQRLRQGQAPHIEPYCWMAAATKQKDSVMAASRIISTCPLRRAGFPDGRTCEDCFCGAKPRRGWALAAQPVAAPKQATLPRQGLSFIRTVLQDPQYRVKTLQRLRAGRLAPSLERYLWRLAFGKLDEMEASVRPRDFRISFMNEAEDPLKRPAAAPAAAPVQKAADSGRVAVVRAEAQSPARFDNKVADAPSGRVVLVRSATGEVEEFVIPEDDLVLWGPMCETCVGIGHVRTGRGNEMEPCHDCGGRGRRHQETS
jgi:hypothetical protein